MAIIDSQNIFENSKLDGDRKKAHGKAFPSNPDHDPNPTTSFINNFSSGKQYGVTEDEAKSLKANDNATKEMKKLKSTDLYSLKDFIDEKQYPENLREVNESFFEKVAAMEKNWVDVAPPSS